MLGSRWRPLMLSSMDDVDLPFVVESKMGVTRLWYAVISGLFFIVTAMVPNTYLWLPGSVNSGSAMSSWICLVIAYILAVGSFALVQGSDPGYIPRAIDMSNIERDTSKSYGKNYRRKHCSQQSRVSSSEESIDDDSHGSQMKDRQRLHGLGSEYETVQDPSEYQPGGPLPFINGRDSYNAEEDADSGDAESTSETSTMNLGGDITIDTRSESRCRKPRKSQATIISSKATNKTPQNKVFNITEYGEDCYVMCRWCESPAPVRSHHCRECQRCVATFDHHCNVIGTCIGEKNHCRFVVFLLINFFGVWYCSHLADSSFQHPIKVNNPVIITTTGVSANAPSQTNIMAPPSLLRGARQELVKYPELAYMASICAGIVWWFLVLLLSMQLYVVLSGATTYEVLKAGPQQYYSVFAAVGGSVSTSSSRRDGDSDIGVGSGDGSTSNSSNSSNSSSSSGNDGSPTSVSLSEKGLVTTKLSPSSSSPVPRVSLPHTGQPMNNMKSFFLERDGLIAFLKGEQWQPRVWQQRNDPEVDIQNVEVCDNICWNKYYSCC